jgi:cytochrome b561
MLISTTEGRKHGKTIVTSYVVVSWHVSASAAHHYRSWRTCLQLFATLIY